jgi:hypothetical protein
MSNQKQPPAPPIVTLYKPKDAVKQAKAWGWEGVSKRIMHMAIASRDIQTRTNAYSKGTNGKPQVEIDEPSLIFWLENVFMPYDTPIVPPIKHRKDTAATIKRNPRALAGTVRYAK